MILRIGFKSFEFQRTFELPKPLTFASRDEALGWLRQQGFLQPGTISWLREYLVRYSDDPECSRLTDHQAVERMAELLYSRQVVTVVREQRGGSGKPAPKVEASAPAFPLAERIPRAASVSVKSAPVEDPPTYDPRLDAVVQAATLVAAARQGKLFCSECTRLKAAAAGTSNE